MLRGQTSGAAPPRFVPCSPRCLVAPFSPFIPLSPSFPVRDLKSVAIFGGLAASASSPSTAAVAALPMSTDDEPLLQVHYRPASVSVSLSFSNQHFLLSGGARHPHLRPSCSKQNQKNCRRSCGCESRGRFGFTPYIQGAQVCFACPGTFPTVAPTCDARAFAAASTTR